MSNPNMNSKRKAKTKLTHAVNVLFAYLTSGALIVYGGVNLSTNGLQLYRGMYKGQWYAAIPFVLTFGLLPIIAGILVLMLHPATSGKPAKKT